MAWNLLQLRAGIVVIQSALYLLLTQKDFMNNNAIFKMRYKQIKPMLS